VVRITGEGKETKYRNPKSEKKRKSDSMCLEKIKKDSSISHIRLIMEKEVRISDRGGGTSYLLS